MSVETKRVTRQSVALKSPNTPTKKPTKATPTREKKVTGEGEIGVETALVVFKPPIQNKQDEEKIGKVTRNVLEREAWMELVNERDFFLGWQELQKLKVGDTLDLASSLDQGPHDDISNDVTYPAATFWASCRETYTIVSDNRGVRTAKLGDNTYVGEKGDKAPPFYDDGGTAALGGGADYSMLWSNIVRMPPLYTSDS
jgi:hypothetical protein